ncbi:hypothetical protein PUN28_013394 [Cardiocondyla obscurior]|uniref:Uncharacterized protein n=1 Tax=Cardiocondyla obscurior TaxID=286306 RepID=A0AAW2FDU4_9HYME
MHRRKSKVNTRPTCPYLLPDFTESVECYVRFLRTSRRGLLSSINGHAMARDHSNETRLGRSGRKRKSISIELSPVGR